MYIFHYTSAWQQRQDRILINWKVRKPMHTDSLIYTRNLLRLFRVAEPNTGYFRRLRQCPSSNGWGARHPLPEITEIDAFNCGKSNSTTMGRIYRETYLQGIANIIESYAVRFGSNGPSNQLKWCQWLAWVIIRVTPNLSILILRQIWW